MKAFTDWIIYAATFVGAVGTITGIVIKWLNSKLAGMIAPMQSQIHKMDVKECRRFLIDFLVDVENGIEKQARRFIQTEIAVLAKELTEKLNTL